ncbi:hypothetical protein HFP15_19180 [Amycolatopsis sp. K13G38]|uniref:Lipoyl-binding domain-containing protein n=1 Tax=Amycolatopsis acididurans TaxID=2724524 RepID=A0ABX1J606_9PSEU|nr:biotin/lipoyl-containing protein [Amycolatopsis acididurans]NKQ55009.1 hypothetical protein [Amycolatopsis acididurans]
MAEIVVPKWGLTIEEVTLLEWLKEVGEHVEVDEPIASVETDKVTQDIVSQVSGTIVEILAKEGDELQIGQSIARVES